MKSNIVLCCINPTRTHQDIDEFSIYKIFKQHVIVKNVRVFNRDKQIKAFILLEDKESINTAISALHKKELNVGRISIYPSYKKYIAFDKPLQTIIQEALAKESSEKSDLKEEESCQEKIDYLISKKSSIKTLDTMRGKNSSKKLVNRLFESDDHFQQKLNELNLKQTENNINFDDLNSDDEVVMSKIDLTQFCKPKLTRTALLKLENIDFTLADQITIFNFFGCFGNITKLLIDKKKNYAILELQDTIQAKNVKNNSDKAVFCKNPVKVSYFFDSDVFDSIDEEDSMIKVYVNHSRFFRFKKNLNIKINKPTNILHVTNLSTKVSPIILYQLVSQIRDPVNIFKLAKKGVNSDMYLIEFEKIEDSTAVLCVLHNKKVDGKLMKLSFSHTELSDK